MPVPKFIKGMFALSPIVVMLLIYLAGSLVAHDFYSIPIAVAFLIASVYAICITRGMPLKVRLEKFSQGAASSGIMNMIWIFVLAGAFSAVAKKMGAIDSAVNLALEFVPADYIPAGVFVTACFISMAIGTSVGTIVALVPVVADLAVQLDCGTSWLVAIVVGGAFFGDNLSFISDTTIAATQTQHCSMRSKFRANIFLVAPAALGTLLIYVFAGSGMGDSAAGDATVADLFKCMPYMLVILLALIGLNVLLVLVIGVVAAAVVGLLCGAFTPISILTVTGDGVMSMSELIIVTMLAGGLLELVRVNGGIDFIIRLVSASIKGRRSAEFSICALTALSNACTANNTIAILTVGDISRDISQRCGITPRRSASLLDTTSCFVQGMLPYGIQLLTAAKYVGVTPISIIPHLYYPMCVGLVLFLSIIVGKVKWRKHR
ncbi:MAG: Na+/H+ antiporter NhaC family protein [Bacteroidaceae bacterium]|nr:Na+/H+ antiporter NhaC family protein [Bacteroidaceae bacterium]